MSARDVPPPPRQRPEGAEQPGNGQRPASGPPGRAPRRTSAPDPAAASLVDSVKAVVADVTALVRAELDLAKAEVAHGAQRKALGAGLLGAAVGLVGIAFLALLIAAGFALTQEAGLPGWASALIIAAALLLVAVILALVGGRQLATPVSTAATQQRVSEDVEWVTQRIKESR